MKNLFKISDEIPAAGRNAIQVFLFFIAAQVFVITYFTYQVIARSTSWHFEAGLGLGIALLGMELLGLYLTRRNRHELGIWLFLATMAVVFPSVSALFAGMGIIIAVSALLLFSGIASVTLPMQKRWQVVFLSIGAGIFAALIDLYIPIVRPVAGGFKVLIVAAIILLVVGFFYIVTREFRKTINEGETEYLQPSKKNENQDIGSYRYLVLVTYLMGAPVIFVVGMGLWFYFQTGAWQGLALCITGLLYGLGGGIANFYVKRKMYRLALYIIIVTYWLAPAMVGFLFTGMPFVMFSIVIYHTTVITIIFPEKLPFRIILTNLIIYLIYCVSAFFVNIDANIPEIIIPMAVLTNIFYIIFSIPFYLNFKQIQLASKLLAIQMQVSLVGFVIFLLMGLEQDTQLVFLIVQGITWIATAWILQILLNPLWRLTENIKIFEQGGFPQQIAISSNDEIGVLGSSFNQMATRLKEVLQNLEEKIKDRTRDLNISSSVSREITRELNMELLLPKLVEQTREGFALYQASVFLYDSQKQELLLAAGSGEAGRRMKAEAKSFPLNAKPSLVAEAARKKKPIVVNNVEEVPDYFANPLLPETHAEAVIPMSVGDELIGVLDLQSEIAGRFTENDLLIFATLAEQIAIAVRNADLYQRQIELTRNFQIVSQVSREISSQLRFGELLPDLVENTMTSFDLYFVSIYIFDETKNQLILRAGTGEAGRQMISGGMFYGINASPSLVAQAARERRMIVVQNVILSEMYFSNPYLPLTKSEVAIPLIAQDNLIGVLGMQSKQFNGFSGEMTKVLATLADQIAVAVQNARLYEGQEHMAEELIRVDKMKSQFLASMSHELRTPMNAIMNFVEMVALEYAGPVNEQQKELLNQSVESSKHLLHLINDVLDISKIQAGQLSLFIEKDVDLHDEVDTVLGMAKTLIKDKPVSIIEDIDDDIPILVCDRRRVRQVLLNLLSNAIKFTDEGIVTLSIKNQGSQILMAVIDDGPGISTEFQAKIFEPFTQTQDGIKQVEGTGLGLPISRSLVEAHGGKLWVESHVGDGAAFYFTLPVITDPSILDEAQ